MFWYLRTTAPAYFYLKGIAASRDFTTRQKNASFEVQLDSGHEDFRLAT
jgi:hypothetical protein